MAGSVYYIWKARNELIFGNKLPNLEGTIEHIVRDVNKDLCRASNISETILF